MMMGLQNLLAKDDVATNMITKTMNVMITACRVQAREKLDNDRKTHMNKFQRTKAQR